MTAPEKILEFVRHGRKKDGFLEDIRSRHLPQRTPVVDVTCGDFRRVCESTRHLARLRGYADHEHHEVHELRWHGGAIRLVPGSKSNRGAPDDVKTFSREVLAAARLTKIGFFKLRAHLPCGWAADTDMEPEEVVADLMTARVLLLETLPELTVLAVLHVDYRSLTREEKMRNYLVSPEKWTARLPR